MVNVIETNDLTNLDYQQEIVITYTKQHFTKTRSGHSFHI